MSNTNPDAQEMVRLYVEEERSVRDIATRFGCSYGRVYGLLRSRIVLRRSGGRNLRRTTEYVAVAGIMRRRIVIGDPVGDITITPPTGTVTIAGVRGELAVRRAQPR